jgi:hypothetical protein
MKSIKITTIIVAIIATFASCKKENSIIKNTDPKDFTTANMRMNYYGKILEYTVKYSPSKDIRIIEGKDAAFVQQLQDTYKSSITVFDKKNETHFFKDKQDYYYYISNINNNTTYRKKNTTNNEVGYSRQNTDFWFYRDAYRTNLIISDNINTLYTPVQTFMLRQPCNDGTNNSCPTYTMNYIGKKVSWVGDNNNDCISSIRLRNYQQNSYAGVVTITLFQDINFGGNAIAFYFPQYVFTYDMYVDNLKDYKINSLLKKWNDRTSSYECFYPWN